MKNLFLKGVSLLGLVSVGAFAAFDSATLDPVKADITSAGEAMLAVAVVILSATLIYRFVKNK